FESCAVARNRLDCELTSDGPYAFFKHQGTPSAQVKFGLREAPGKLEAPTVVLDHQLPQAVLSREADQDAARVAVLADVYERLLDDTVVELARDPGPLHRHGTGTQAAQTVDAVDGRPHLLHQAMKKAQLTLAVSSDARVEEEKATRPLVALA